MVSSPSGTERPRHERAGGGLADTKRRREGDSHREQGKERFGQKCPGVPPGSGVRSHVIGHTGVPPTEQR